MVMYGLHSIVLAFYKLCSIYGGVSSCSGEASGGLLPQSLMLCERIEL